MASRIAYAPSEPVRSTKRPRLKDGPHRRFIRDLPCVICGQRYKVEAAHLRTGSRLVGKRPTGMGERPSDRWCTPLCGGPGGHHAEQHTMNELEFWSRYGIENPFQLALALFAASVAEDIEMAEHIVAEHRLLAAGMVNGSP